MLIHFLGGVVSMSLAETFETARPGGGGLLIKICKND